MPTYRSKGNKDRDLARHVRERFAVRFDIVLTHAVEKSIIQQIERGNSTFIEKQSNRISRHRVTVEDKLIDVIYDKNRRRLVTAMFPEDKDWWENAIND